MTQNTVNKREEETRGLHERASERLAPQNTVNKREEETPLVATHAQKDILLDARHPSHHNLCTISSLPRV